MTDFEADGSVVMTEREADALLERPFEFKDDLGSDDPVARAVRALRLMRDEDVAYLDAKSNLPRPSDFGEFPEIPEEAVGAQVMVVEAKDIKGTD